MKHNSEIFDNWYNWCILNCYDWRLIKENFNIRNSYIDSINSSKYIFSDHKNNILKINNDIFHHLNQINRILNQFKEIKNNEI